MTTETGAFARIGSFVLRIALTVHSVASLAYWIAQPRAFAGMSRSFVEHQVVVPAIFAVSIGGVASIFLNRPRTTWLSVGILAGFWIASAGMIAILGTIAPARLCWGILLAASLFLAVAWRLSRPAASGLLTGGTVAGLALAAVFWACSWAPAGRHPPPGGPARLVGTGRSGPEHRRMEVSAARVGRAGVSRGVADGGLGRLSSLHRTLRPHLFLGARHNLHRTGLAHGPNRPGCLLVGSGDHATLIRSSDDQSPWDEFRA